MNNPPDLLMPHAPPPPLSPLALTMQNSTSNVASTLDAAGNEKTKITAAQHPSNVTPAGQGVGAAPPGSVERASASASEKSEQVSGYGGGAHGRGRRGYYSGVHVTTLVRQEWEVMGERERELELQRAEKAKAKKWKVILKRFWVWLWT